MLIETEKKVVINLDTETKVALDYRQAMALYLFTSRLGWHQEKDNRLELLLERPVAVADPLRSTTPYHTDMLFAFGDFESKTITFVLGRKTFGAVDIKELMFELQAVITEYADMSLVMPQLDGVVEGHELEATYHIPNDRLFNGYPIRLTIEQEYVSFTISVNGYSFEITDTKLFMGNTRIARGEGVAKVGFATDTFEDGFRMKEIKKHIRYRFADSVTDKRKVLY